MALGHIIRRLLIHAGHDDVGGIPAFHGCEDAVDLLGGLARAVDYFLRALTQAPVVVHLGIAQVLKGLQLHLKQRLLGRERSLLHLFQQGQHFLFFHCYSSPRGSRSNTTAANCGFNAFTSSFRCSSALLNWAAGSCSLAVSPTQRTRKSEKPNRNNSFSAASTRCNASVVMAVPVGMRVARQA